MKARKGSGICLYEASAHVHQQMKPSEAMMGEHNLGLYYK
jgi:hypothetical protein